MPLGGTHACQKARCGSGTSVVRHTTVGPACRPESRGCAATTRESTFAFFAPSTPSSTNTFDSPSLEIGLAYFVLRSSPPTNAPCNSGPLGSGHPVRQTNKLRSLLYSPILCKFSCSLQSCAEHRKLHSAVPYQLVIVQQTASRFSFNSQPRADLTTLCQSREQKSRLTIASGV
ncbi:hypothetical protein K437DRAFT_162864 [Tilletiaria anomala UBC 951]|uniref:Uncharacterized protein n=1 Tax=Tilletiaria anomala (strain ATCC 24038 / CBS 436.72 / UBC 951) TaxID=1037660 RepID=A0A066WFH4_TILAU|nr:uncharacterized protein K437DRAFT_162864 [Tilletiaria anomala UBC 951]KDN52727.1 hypothetical protein K437DRAFT_162864 [Tilletiaria anomala UBC 951]